MSATTCYVAGHRGMVGSAMRWRFDCRYRIEQVSRTLVDTLSSATERPAGLR